MSDGKITIKSESQRALMRAAGELTGRTLNYIETLIKPGISTKELDEAAKIDGANSWQVFTKILLPAVKPVMLAVLVMALVYNWNDFFNPLIYLNSSEKFTIAVGLQFFKGSQGNVQIGQMMAMALVSLTPVLFVFATCQKYFIQGIKMSGLKG